MRTHLIQTDRAIHALLAAGYKRNEFSVRSPYSKRHGGYMETRIYVRASPERQAELAPKVLASGDINIIEWIINGVTSKHYSYELGHGKMLTKRINTEVTND